MQENFIFWQHVVHLFSISWSLGMFCDIQLHNVCLWKFQWFITCSASHFQTCFSMMDPRFHWHFSPLSLFLCFSLSLSRSRWCNVKLGTEPSSAAAMRPVLTHGYSSSFSASNPHFSIISSPACVCERLTADGDYRFLPMNQQEHNWSLSFTFYSPVLSVCHQASPTLWAVTPEQDAHLGWTQLYTYVCV